MKPDFSLADNLPAITLCPLPSKVQRPRIPLSGSSSRLHPWSPSNSGSRHMLKSFSLPSHMGHKSPSVHLCPRYFTIRSKYTSGSQLLLYLSLFPSLLTAIFLLFTHITLFHKKLPPTFHIPRLSKGLFWAPRIEDSARRYASNAK